MSDDVAAARLPYQPQLDGLRAIAVLAVMAFHTSASFTGGGFLGVDVFFVLSGFLITTLLLQEEDRSGSISLSAFYARRARRLLPALFVVVAVTVVVYSAFNVGGDRIAAATRRDAPLAIFYVISWFKAYGLGDAGALTHAWSLSVEEHFYFVWPLVVIATRRIRRYRTAIFGVVVSVAALYVAAHAVAGTPSIRMYFAPDTRFYSLATGCLLAALLRGRRLPHRSLATEVSLVAASTFIAAMFLVARFSWRPYYLGLGVLFAIAVAVVIAHLMTFPTSPVARLLAAPPLVWIGVRSYGIYLWQVPVIEFFDFELERYGALRLAVAIVVTLLLAAASYKWVERPILGRRAVVTTSPTR